MRTIGILIAIAAACGGAKPPGSEAPGTTTPTNPQTTAPDKQSFDKSFIDAMVPHHRYVIALAQVAKERAKRPEVQAFAESLARTSQGEADRMVEWRRTWFGSGDVPDYGSMVTPEGIDAYNWRDGWEDVEKAAQNVGTGKSGQQGQAQQAPPTPGKAGQPAAQPVAQQMPTGDPTAWTPQQRIEALRTANVDVDKAFLDVLIPLSEHGVSLAKAAQTRADKAELREFARAIRDTEERTLSQARQWRETWYGEPARMHTPAPATAPDERPNPSSR